MGSSTLATLSDELFTYAITVYSVALLGFCGEYAFGRRGRIAHTVAPARAEHVLVGAGAPAQIASPDAQPAAAPPQPTSPLGRAAAAQWGGRAGVTLMAVAAALHAGSIALRAGAVDRVPWGNMYEFSSVVGLVAVVTFAAVLLRQHALRYLGMFVLLPVIVVMFLAGTVLYARAEPLVPALQSYWLAIHVSAAAVATGIFLISFVASMLYLIRARWERVATTSTEAAGSLHFPISLGARLPSAENLDRMAYRTIAFGFPIWTFAIICGAIWAEAAWGRYWGWDPKETWAFISWVIYAAYLHARATAGWRGNRVAVINVLGFATMTFNFFVVNIVIAGLHSYAGLN